MLSTATILAKRTPGRTGLGMYSGRGRILSTVYRNINLRCFAVAITDLKVSGEALAAVINTLIFRHLLNR